MEQASPRFAPISVANCNCKTETLTRKQVHWWWAFLISLIISSSVTSSTLATLLYLEQYYTIDDSEPKIAKNAGSPTPIDNEVANSSSFKTVLTINSALPPNLDGNINELEPTTPPQPPPQPPQPPQPPPPSPQLPPIVPDTQNAHTVVLFNNDIDLLTKRPTGIQSFAFKGPVTVVDMRKNAKDRSKAPLPPPVVDHETQADLEKADKPQKNRNKKIKKNKKPRDQPIS